MVEINSIDLSHHFSDEANSRSVSKLKDAFKHFRNPKIISMAGGLPLPDLFPFNELSIETIKPPFAHGIDKPAQTEEDKLTITIKKFEDSAESPFIPLSESLQYGTSDGQVSLRMFIEEHTRMVHDVGYANWTALCTVGNTHGLDAVLRTFTNRGDTILAEQYTFASAGECIHSNGLKIVPVEMDLEGMVPEKLETLMENWQGPKPKLLYTIPTGQNPTGSTLSNERRAAIYKIAKKYDLLIVEDEPYYFLQMPQYESDKAKRAAEEAEEAKTLDHPTFLKNLVNSFLNYDTEGRVIRLDSFSKVLAPGSRLGWIITNTQFAERLLRCLEVSVQAPSGLSQSAIHGVLSSWGQSGYVDWLIALRKEYTRKRNTALDAMNDYLPKSVASFIAPTAGMFFWIKLDAKKHKKFEELKGNVEQLEMDLYEAGISGGAQMPPGSWFSFHDETGQQKSAVNAKEIPSLFFRGTFASVPEEKLVEGMKRFARVLEEEFYV